MNAILDPAKRKRAGLVLIAALLATGCAEKAEEPFVDPEFDFLLDIGIQRSMAGSETNHGFQLATTIIDMPPRFGGPIAYDANTQSWRNKAGEKIDLSTPQPDLNSDYAGDTNVLMDPDAPLSDVSAALASLAEAGICLFNKIEAEDLEKGQVKRPVTHYEYGDLIRILAFRSKEGAPMVCREGKPPEIAKAGYSRHSSIWKANHD